MGITLRPRFPSAALILSCLALFAALGGGAYAASSSGGSGIKWTNAKLKGTWKNAGNGLASAGYAKDSLGVVHLRGDITGGSPGTTAFVLPKGLRPSHALLIAVSDSVGGSTAQIEIVNSGAIVPSGAGAAGTTSFDGVSFVAGQ